MLIVYKEITYQDYLQTLQRLNISENNVQKNRERIFDALENDLKINSFVFLEDKL